MARAPRPTPHDKAAALAAALRDADPTNPDRAALADLTEWAAAVARVEALDTEIEGIEARLTELREQRDTHQGTVTRLNPRKGRS